MESLFLHRMEAVLRAHAINKSFGPVKVLEGVSFDLRAGEVHTLMGENGAGKSTLLKILAGLHRPDSGHLEIDGDPVTISTSRAAQEAGIALIHQEPLTFPDLDIAENIFLGHGGRWPLFRLVRWRRRYTEARSLLQSLGVNLNPRVLMAGLSIADQQMVEMAAALSQKARILLMDEPTAALTPDEVRQLFAIVRRLRDNGTAIVFISHRLEEVFQISDRITVLRDGHFIATHHRDETSVPEIIRLMVGRPLASFYEKTAAPVGASLLEVRGLGRGTRFDGISFKIRAGEVVGMAGLVGAGRTDVAKSLFGIAPADRGELKVDGKAAKVGCPSDGIRLGIAMVPEDRQAHGIFRSFSIGENLSASSLSSLFPRGWIVRGRERDIAKSYRQKLQILCRGSDQSVSELSGGNQQKVVLGKWLHTQPRILILDEPTRGIDVGAKQEVHRLISELAREGKAILLISSDLPEVLAMSDRILVLREGKMTGEFTRDEATAEKIMAAATGQPDQNLS